MTDYSAVLDRAHKLLHQELGSSSPTALHFVDSVSVRIGTSGTLPSKPVEATMALSDDTIYFLGGLSKAVPFSSITALELSSAACTDFAIRTSVQGLERVVVQSFNRRETAVHIDSLWASSAIRKGVAEGLTPEDLAALTLPVSFSADFDVIETGRSKSNPRESTGADLSNPLTFLRPWHGCKRVLLDKVSFFLPDDCHDVGGGVMRTVFGFDIQVQLVERSTHRKLADGNTVKTQLSGIEQVAHTFKQSLLSRSGSAVSFADSSPGTGQSSTSSFEECSPTVVLDQRYLKKHNFSDDVAQWNCWELLLVAPASSIRGPNQLSSPVYVYGIMAQRCLAPPVLGSGDIVVSVFTTLLASKVESGLIGDEHILRGVRFIVDSMSFTNPTHKVFREASIAALDEGCLSSTDVAYLGNRFKVFPSFHLLAVECLVLYDRARSVQEVLNKLTQAIGASQLQLTVRHMGNLICVPNADPRLASILTSITSTDSLKNDASTSGSSTKADGLKLSPDVEFLLLLLDFKPVTSQGRDDPRAHSSKPSSDKTLTSAEILRSILTTGSHAQTIDCNTNLLNAVLTIPKSYEFLYSVLNAVNPTSEAASAQGDDSEASISDDHGRRNLAIFASRLVDSFHDEEPVMLPLLKLIGSHADHFMPDESSPANSSYAVLLAHLFKQLIAVLRDGNSTRRTVLYACACLVNLTASDFGKAAAVNADVHSAAFWVLLSRRLALEGTVPNLLGLLVNTTKTVTQVNELIVKTAGPERIVQYLTRLLRIYSTSLARRYPVTEKHHREFEDESLLNDLSSGAKGMSTSGNVTTASAAQLISIICQLFALLGQVCNSEQVRAIVTDHAAQSQLTDIPHMCCRAVRIAQHQISKNSALDELSDADRSKEGLANESSKPESDEVEYGAADLPFLRLLSKGFFTLRLIVNESDSSHPMFSKIMMATGDIIFHWLREPRISADSSSEVAGILEELTIASALLLYALTNTSLANKRYLLNSGGDKKLQEFLALLSRGPTGSSFGTKIAGCSASLRQKMSTIFDSLIDAR